MTYATNSDWDRLDAEQQGSERPKCAWVCTDRDVWHANPFYQGPPVPHPEEAADLYFWSMDKVEEQDRMEMRGGPLYGAYPSRSSGFDIDY